MRDEIQHTVVSDSSLIPHPAVLKPTDLLLHRPALISKLRRISFFWDVAVLRTGKERKSYRERIGKSFAQVKLGRRMEGGGLALHPPPSTRHPSLHVRFTNPDELFQSKLGLSVVIDESAIWKQMGFSVGEVGPVNRLHIRLTQAESSKDGSPIRLGFVR